jgi:hypothetical protein
MVDQWGAMIKHSVSANPTEGDKPATCSKIIRAEDATQTVANSQRRTPGNEKSIQEDSLKGRMASFEDDLARLEKEMTECMQDYRSMVRQLTTNS